MTKLIFFLSLCVVAVYSLDICPGERNVTSLAKAKATLLSHHSEHLRKTSISIYSSLNVHENTKPLALIFEGPTGGGQTELALLLARSLSGQTKTSNQTVHSVTQSDLQSDVIHLEDLGTLWINGSRFLHSENAEQKRKMFNAVAEYIQKCPNGLVIFSGMHKAHPSSLREFVTILHDNPPYLRLVAESTAAGGENKNSGEIREMQISTKRAVFVFLMECGNVDQSTCSKSILTDENRLLPLAGRIKKSISFPPPIKNLEQQNAVMRNLTLSILGSDPTNDQIDQTNRFLSNFLLVAVFGIVSVVAYLVMAPARQAPIVPQKSQEQKQVVATEPITPKQQVMRTVRKQSNADSKSVVPLKPTQMTNSKNQATAHRDAISAQNQVSNSCGTRESPEEITDSTSDEESPSE